ncbi:MAG: LPXTG cell wall anchor domain-containing protein [Clostridia bacterium]|nr:LPXTG cell wall anchor domain-containing protein [Clostridia bacterium]
MTKKIRAAVAAFALIISLTVFALSVSAAVVPTDYSAFGQVKFEAYLGGNEPTVDGVISEGEYKNNFEAKKGTAGVYHDKDAAEPIITSVKFGITVTDDAIYLGITVAEPNYKFRVGSTAGSYMAFSLGFNMGDKFYQCMDRQTLSLQIKDDNTLFRVNSVLTYGSDGKFTTEYKSDVFGAAAATRNDTNGTTVYEVKLLKDKLIAAQDTVTEIGNLFYIHFECVGYDAAGTQGKLLLRDLLSADDKNTIQAQDGWCASFAPHLLSLSAEPVETTAEQTTAEQTTAEQATTPETQPSNPTTGDSGFMPFIILGIIGLAVPATVVALRSKKD